MKLEIYITPQIYKRGPNIKLISKKHIHVFENFKENKITCEIEDAPTKFSILHYDKADTDVQVENGKIVNDVGFSLNTIIIDGHVLTNEIFGFKTHYADRTSVSGNNYFGHNCYMTFDINQSLDFWIFDLKHQQTNDDHEIDVQKFIEEILS